MYYWTLPVRGDELREDEGAGAEAGDDTYVVAGAGRGWGEERGVEAAAAGASRGEGRGADLPEQPIKRKETSFDLLHNNKTYKAKHLKISRRLKLDYYRDCNSKHNVFAHTDHPFVLILKFW